MDITDVQNLGPIIDALNNMAAQFSAMNTPFQISSLVLAKGVDGGSITFTWNPDAKTYNVTISQ